MSKYHPDWLENEHDWETSSPVPQDLTLQPTVDRLTKKNDELSKRVIELTEELHQLKKLRIRLQK